MRRSILLALCLVACAVSAPPAIAESCNDDAVGTQTPAGTVGVGLPAPSFELATLDGDRITNDTAAGRILVIEFVAPNCPWCKRHLPRAGLLKAVFEPQPVRFVAVAGQLGTVSFSDAEVLSIVHAAGFNGQVARDTDRSLAASFAALLPDRQMHYPAVFVLDFDGRVEAAVAGYGRESEIQAAIARLLGKPAGEDDLLFPPPSPSHDLDPLIAAESAPILLPPVEAAAPTISEVDHEALPAAIPTEPESAAAASAAPPVSMEYIFHSATNRTIAIRAIPESRRRAQGSSSPTPSSSLP